MRTEGADYAEEKNVDERNRSISYFLAVHRGTPADLYDDLLQDALLSLTLKVLLFNFNSAAAYQRALDAEPPSLFLPQSQDEQVLEPARKRAILSQSPVERNRAPCNQCNVV